MLRQYRLQDLGIFNTNEFLTKRFTKLINELLSSHISAQENLHILATCENILHTLKRHRTTEDELRRLRRGLIEAYLHCASILPDYYAKIWLAKFHFGAEPEIAHFGENAIMSQSSYRHNIFDAEQMRILTDWSRAKITDSTDIATIRDRCTACFQYYSRSLPINPDALTDYAAQLIRDSFASIHIIQAVNKLARGNFLATDIFITFPILSTLQFREGQVILIHDGGRYDLNNFLRYLRSCALERSLAGYKRDLDFYRKTKAIYGEADKHTISDLKYSESRTIGWINELYKSSSLSEERLKLIRDLQTGTTEKLAECARKFIATYKEKSQTTLQLETSTQPSNDNTRTSASSSNREPPQRHT